MKRCALSGWGPGHDRFHSSSRCKQHVAHPSAANVRLVEGKGHSVQRDDVEGTTVDLDISIEIGAGVRDAPKLMLSRGDLNFWPDDAVDGEHALRLFRVRTAALRLQGYFAHQCRSLWPLLIQFRIAKHHDPLLHVPKFRKVTIDAFYYDGPRHPVQILTITLHVLVGVIPVETRGLVARHVDCVSERLTRSGRHGEYIVLWALG